MPDFETHALGTAEELAKLRAFANLVVAHAMTQPSDEALNARCRDLLAWYAQHMERYPSP
jgi:hypothetical protein